MTKPVKEKELKNIKDKDLKKVAGGQNFGVLPCPSCGKPVGCCVSPDGRIIGKCLCGYEF